MNKKYIVRLSDEERGVCQEIVKRLKGTSEKVKRAQILLRTDVAGPGWPDAKIAEAHSCSVRTVENLRERLVTEGFEAALERKKRATAPTPRKLDGEGEAKLIAMRLGKPPAGYGRWSLQLLADELVALEVVDSICPETVRKTLKKRHDQTQDRVLGHSARPGRGVRGEHGRRARNLCTGLRSRATGGVHGRAAGPVVKRDQGADRRDEGAWQTYRL